MLTRIKRTDEEKKEILKQIETLTRGGALLIEAFSKTKITATDYYRWKKALLVTPKSKSKKKRKTYMRKTTEPQAEIFNETHAPMPPATLTSMSHVFAFYGNAKEVASVVRSLQ